MMKLNERLLLLTVFFFMANVAMGQKYMKNYLTYKIIVNDSSHNIVAYVKPVRILYTEADKQYYWFSGHQISSTQGGYSGKLLNGNYQDYYTNKILKESGVFNGGLKNGIWKSWDVNGKLKEEYTWVLGRKNGRYLKYDSLGNVAEKGKYRNNLLHGNQQIFQAGNTTTVYYKKGKVTEKQSCWPKFIKRIFSKKNKVPAS